MEIKLVDLQLKALTATLTLQKVIKGVLDEPNSWESFNITLTDGELATRQMSTLDSKQAGQYEKNGQIHIYQLPALCI